MRFTIHALACLAIAIPVSLGGGSEPEDDSDPPNCRASLEGDVLTTVIEFAGGYAVEGPWKVLLSERDEEATHFVTATLDRVVEVQNGSGERVVSAFPSPIKTTFEGRDDAEVAQRAAEVWCVVVMKAHGHMPRAPAADGPAPRVAVRLMPGING